MDRKAWEEELAGIMPRVLELRRDFHRHPQLSGHEERTQQKIMELMRQLGYHVQQCDGNAAVIATMANGAGKCIAIRADMDALPITENNQLPFASENSGVMHACGHDVHMALACGSAMWFAEKRSRWHGTVKYLFEPAQETIGGGKAIVEQGFMENPHVDYVIGQHVNPRYRAGQFFAKPGCVSGSSDEILLTVHGKRSHGAYPEGGVDAIVISAAIITALQTLVSRSISPFESAVVTIGTINGGTANNIISGEVQMTGTLRTLTSKAREHLQQRIRCTCEGIAQSMGGSCEVIFRPSYGAVWNDEKAYAIIARRASEIMGEENMILREAPSLGVDSFCYYVQDYPGVYYDIGSGIGTALHTDTFMVDEACLPVGIAYQIASYLGLQEEG